ncbi:MAG: SDR family oxidoreductase [Hyphomicrobiaceae bacterium]
MNSFARAIGDRWIGVKPQQRDAASRHVIPAVVVTGGSSGIGLAIALEFHRQGEAVVLVARDQEDLNAARLSFARSERVHVLSLDITAPDAPERLDTALRDRSLYLDILVNSAGTGLAGPFDSHSSTEIAHLIDLNVTALTRLTRHVLPAMKSRARGGVLNVASLGGYIPGPNQAAYYASKAYVCSLTEALAAELVGSGVRMTVAAPGPIETKFHAKMGADYAGYRWIMPALSPARAARSAVFAYQLGSSVVVPGLIYKGMAVAVTIIPHWLTLPVIRLLLAPR